MLGDHVGRLEILSMLIELSLKTLLLQETDTTVASELIPCCILV